MKNSQDSWAIKDCESRYVYMNEAVMENINVPKNFDVEGKLDKELPVKVCQELWPEFVNFEKRVMDENRTISSIAIHCFGKGNVGNPTPYLLEKTPLYDDQSKIIGTVGHGRVIDAPSLLFYMNRFNKKTIQFDAPNDVFTKRELDVIFWAQQRLSAKEIAKRLDLSPRTVENNLQFIYEKSGVHSIIQLIEYCKQTGLDSYIPFDFVRKGFQLIE